MIYRVSIIAAVVVALLVPNAAIARGHKGGSHYSHGYTNSHGTYVHGGYHHNPRSHKKHG